MPGLPVSSSDSHPTDAPTDIDIATFLHFLDKTAIKRGIADDSPRRTLDADRNLLSELYVPPSGASGSRKSRSVLDSLVAICIFDPHICLALSVTFSASPSVIEICVAQNGTRPPKIVATHLHSIWTQLQAISQLQRKIRVENNLADTFADDNSPQSAEKGFGKASAEHPWVADMWALKDTLAIDIHRFCFKKTKRRVKKYLESFPAFYNFYTKNGRNLDVNRQLEKIVFGLVFIRKTVLGIAAKEPLGLGENRLDWEKLAEYSDLLVSFYEQQDKEELEPRMRLIMAGWANEPNVKG